VLLLEVAARGCPRPGAGVADERSHGWRSEVSIERAKAPEGRSERPAMGMGSLSLSEQFRIKCEPHTDRVYSDHPRTQELR